MRWPRCIFKHDDKPKPLATHQMTSSNSWTYAISVCAGCAEKWTGGMFNTREIHIKVKKSLTKAPG